VISATWKYPELGGVVRVVAGAVVVGTGWVGIVVLGSDVLCAPLHPNAKPATASRNVALVMAGRALRVFKTNLQAVTLA
jgi:hypothetical protein